MPLSVVHAEMARVGADVPSFGEVKLFFEKYENAKRLHDRVDFVDIVGRFAGVHFGLEGPEMVEPHGELPPGGKGWIFDEYQDSSKLVDLACRRLVSGPDVIWSYLAAEAWAPSMMSCLGQMVGTAWPRIRTCGQTSWPRQLCARPHCPLLT
jgi:hypothetical protein